MQLLICVFADFSVRIQSQSAEYFKAGRVEILNNGQWGLVCADGWDTRDATIFCQEKTLGNNGTATQIAYNYIETFWLSGVDCLGNESYSPPVHAMLLEWLITVSLLLE